VELECEEVRGTVSPPPPLPYLLGVYARGFSDARTHTRVHYVHKYTSDACVVVFV